MSDHQETYYEILRVAETASATEITAAYHSAKQAFSTDSVAAYSVIDEATNQDFNTVLDEAYHVLSDPKRRKKYDSKLKNLTPSGETVMETPTQVAQALSESPPPHAIIEATQTETQIPTIGMNGARLKTIRESRNMSMEDVARITKIPLKFLTALEEEDASQMPARVYIQGFVKNLANAYKLDPNETAKAYLQSVDSKIKTNPL